MAQLDALRLTEALRKRLVDFATDDHFARDPALGDLCRRLWGGPPRDGGLISELWVEGAFPAEPSSETLDTLTTRGLFSAELRDQLDRVGAMPRDRLLYTHQIEAVEAGREVDARGERPALVVTAGTGAGKTECFLLPLLNDLFTRPPADEGMQCLIRHSSLITTTN